MRGRLVYLMGPSGSGKDSVLAYAREHCDGLTAVFATRYITRSAQAGGERHVALSPEEFRGRFDAGFFALAWESHGLRYGIGTEIDAWLESGLHVVVNASRAYLHLAEVRYPDLIPVLLTAEPDVLARRLVLRGRESGTEIVKRVYRARSLHCDHPRLVTIDNSGEIGLAGRAFIDLLSSLQPFV
jgi:ribose 1,5-bisphosphokinase